MFSTKKNTYKQHHNENISFYRESSGFLGIKNKLESIYQVDICIVGGGLTGVSTALNLMGKGYSVAILEANYIGSGASGRNGGQLGVGMRKDQSFLEKKFGLSDSKNLWDLGLESVKNVTDLIKKYNIDCALRPGIMHVGNNKKDYKFFIEEIDHMQSVYNYSGYKYFDEKSIKEEINSNLYFSGMLNKDSYHLNPLKLLNGLSKEVLKNGVKIFEKTPVKKIKDKKDYVEITTEHSKIKAGRVVVCCNGYLDNLLGNVRYNFMPINNYLIATEPLGENKAKELIKQNFAVVDSRFMIDYYRFSEDWRLIFGGPETLTANFVKDASTFVSKRMFKVFPQIKGCKIDYSWGGTLAISVNRLPNFGEQMNGKLYYGHAYSGHGLGLSILGGKLISEKIQGNSERFDYFSRIKHLKVPSGDVLRRPVYSTAILYYRFMDFLNKL
jgi:gamma-glutamylputrescine oxidase